MYISIILQFVIPNFDPELKQKNIYNLKTKAALKNAALLFYLQARGLMCKDVARGIRRSISLSSRYAQREADKTSNPL